MSRLSFHRVLGLAALLVLLAGLPFLSTAQAQEQRFLEFQGVLGDRDPAPPNCSFWHELWPQFCRESHQDQWHDANGDGNLSACDFLEFDGIRYHVDWVGPTFVFQDCQFFLEPTGDFNPFNPMCELWEVVYPNHGQIFHVDEWIDANGDGRVSPCDLFRFSGFPTFCHLDDIRLNVRITEAIPPQGCYLCCPTDGLILIDPAGAGVTALDLNGDGMVNVTDFAIFASRYLTQDHCADFSCDGVVSLPDFAIFASHFGHGPGQICECH